MQRRKSWWMGLLFSSLLVLALPAYAHAQEGINSTGEADMPPVVTRIEPGEDHSVIRNNSLHIIAEAEDDLAQPEFLVEMDNDISMRYPDIFDSDQGAGRFDRIYDVAQYNGKTRVIRYTISDAENRVYRYRTVHVESSPALVETQREPGVQIVDADESRLLLTRGDALILKNRSDGSETELATIDYSGRFFNQYKLTPAGVVSLLNTQVEGYSYYKTNLLYWNGENFGSIPNVALASWQVRGNYVVISNGENLQWIDTVTGATRSIPYAPQERNFELEPNGGLLLEPDDAQSDRILRYDPVTGSTATVFEYAGAPRGPVTDGQAILFTLNDGRLMKYLDGKVSEVVQGTTGAQRLVPHVDYEVNDGWLAYQQRNANNTGELYLQSPTGTVTRTGSFTAPIHSLDGSGTLILGWERLYQYRQGMDEPSLIGGKAGVVKWIDGQLRYILGDSIFAVKEGPFDTKAPEWPAGDVLTVTDVTYNSAKLNWQPATDDTGVDKYWLYRGDRLLATLNGDVNSYEVKGLSPKSTYNYSLVAIDSAGNRSSNRYVTVTTAAYTAPGSFQLSDSKTYSDGWYNYEYSLYYGYISSSGQWLSGSWSPPEGFHGVVKVSMASPEGEDYDLSLETVGEGNRLPEDTTLLTGGTEYSAAEVPEGYRAEWRVKGHTGNDYSPDKKVFVYVYIRYDNH